MAIETSAVTPTAVGARYTNPVTYADGVVRTNPDPFVLRFRGTYWCYSSDESGVNVSASPDMVTWESRGHALAVEGRWYYWAPCVIYADGLFWMYFSNRPAGADDPHEEVLQVATSDRPEGPFTVRRAFFDTFSIDPHVVRDPSTGEYVMFYSTNDVTGLNSENPGTSILVDRMVAMDGLLGAPRAAVVPTLDEEIFQRNRFGDGRDWYTIEGATFFAHHGTAFLTYSGNAYVGEDYFIGYSRAELSGPVAELSWRKFPHDDIYAPLVRRNAEVEGTGHNSVVRGPNLVDDWIVYHGRDAAQALDPLLEQRVMRIDQLFHDGDRLSTDAPTWEPQDAPAAPTLFESFGGGSIGEAWQTVAGRFVPERDAVRTDRSALSLLAHDRVFSHVVAEVHVRATVSSAGARYGFVPVFHDDGDHVALLIDATTATLDAVSVRNGISATLGSAPLPGVDSSVWHLMRVQRTFDLLEVWLDEAEVLTVRLPDDRPARLGLVSVATEASFSALTATEHLDVSGPRLGYLPRVFRADRPVRLTADGIGADQRRPVTLSADGFEPGVVLTHEIEVVAPHGRVDLTPVRVDRDTYLRVSLDASSCRVVVVTGGQQEQITHGPAETHLSLRTQVTQDGVVLRLGGHTYRIPICVGNEFSQQVELAGSTLRSFEMTSLGGQPLAGTRTE